jgi:hypothetical protein
MSLLRVLPGPAPHRPPPPRMPPRSKGVSGAELPSPAMRRITPDLRRIYTGYTPDLHLIRPHFWARGDTGRRRRHGPPVGHRKSASPIPPRMPPQPPTSGHGRVLLPVRERCALWAKGDRFWAEGDTAASPHRRIGLACPAGPSRALRAGPTGPPSTLNPRRGFDKPRATRFGSRLADLKFLNPRLRRPGGPGTRGWRSTPRTQSEGSLLAAWTFFPEKSPRPHPLSGTLFACRSTGPV